MYLLSNGCYYAQGYLYYEAMGHEEIEGTIFN